MLAGSQIVVLEAAEGGGRAVQNVLRVLADSIEKSVVALRQLLTEVW